MGFLFSFHVLRLPNANDQPARIPLTPFSSGEEIQKEIVIVNVKIMKKFPPAYPRHRPPHLLYSVAGRIKRETFILLALTRCKFNLSARMITAAVLVAIKKI